MSKRTKLAGAIALTLSCGFASSAFAAPPAAGSAYFTDPQTSRVEDQTSEGIGQVNMITCILSALRGDAMVNKGDYIALVDQNKCDQAKRSSTTNSGSSSEGAQAATYSTTVVNSTRTSNSDPMRVKMWLDETEDGESMTISVNASAVSAPSASNPFGVFRLDFCGRPKGYTGACPMGGYLDAQDGSLSFYQAEGGGGGTTALRLTSVGTTTGSGRMSMTFNDQGQQQTATFNFAYDQTNFLRGNQCFSRDASDPDTRFSVWRYGLYDAATGARVNRTSGFPIEYTSGGQTYHGYLGYWGLSLPGDVTLANGATVQKVDYGSGDTPTRTNYTVMKSEGKLYKYSLRTKKLNQLDKIKFNTFVNNVTGFFSGATPNVQYEMYWDDAAGNFKVTGQMNCGQNGCQTQTLQNEQTVSASFFSQYGAQGWSQSLGGELFIDLRGVGGSVTSANVNVNYRVQDIVYPADFPAQLFCINNCPTAGSMAAFFTPANGVQPPASPFGSTFNVFQPVAAGAVRTYTGDSTAAVIRDGAAQAVTFANKEALSQRPQYMNGVRSGRMFTSLASAECSQGSGTYCDYMVNGLATYYVWETGANQWNQFAAVKDSGGNFVAFDAPLQVNFNVPAGTQYGQYAGKSIVLQYGGFGELWGIPGACVSRVDNQPVSCDTDGSRYVPEFIIPMSDTLGVVSSNGTNYLVKWLEREIRFAKKNASACSNLVLPNNVSLPDASGLKDPSDSASNIYIGTKPTVTGAPRVIHGDVKY